jgi:elongation factor Ts
MKASALLVLLSAPVAAAFVPSSVPFVRNAATSTSLSMAVTTAQIKELRDATGAGMMDCKKALIETDGDVDAANEYLRKAGLVKADKKAARTAAEGKIIVASSEGKTVMVEVNCETDFVAKDDGFLGFANTVAQAAASADSEDVATIMGSSDDNDSLESTRQALVAKIGENIQVRRVAGMGSADTVVGEYVHFGKIGVLVELEGGTPELATDIAMHVAAMNPPYATADQVPAENLEKEKSILAAQVADSGKPPEIIEKMVEGRLRKYLEEICLVSQTYVKTGDKTVGKLLEENGAKMVGFKRIEVGEGIEKKVDDFAAEVAKMAAGGK